MRLTCTHHEPYATRKSCQTDNEGTQPYENVGQKNASPDQTRPDKPVTRRLRDRLFGINFPTRLTQGWPGMFSDLLNAEMQNFKAQLNRDIFEQPVILKFLGEKAPGPKRKLSAWERAVANETARNEAVPPLSERPWYPNLKGDH